MIKVEIKGLDRVRRSLKGYKEQLETTVAATTMRNAQEIELNAKILAPVGITGRLQGDIKATEAETPMSWIINAKAPYSAYQEFGTGGLVDVPDGWEDFAIKFKGKGIRQVNMPPQPFLFPSYRVAVKQYPKDLESDINRLTKIFNNG